LLWVQRQAQYLTINYLWIRKGILTYFLCFQRLQIDRYY